MSIFISKTIKISRWKTIFPLAVCLFLSACSNEINPISFENRDDVYYQNCSMLSYSNALYVLMNKPTFEFAIEDSLLNFNTLQQLDSFLIVNKDIHKEFKPVIVGGKYVPLERIDSVTNLLNKHQHFRFSLVYNKRFIEWK
jgi:hypothetical protein